MSDSSAARPVSWKRWLRRGPWETAAMIAIGLGIFMLTQPFWLALYSYSFVTILGGVVGFLIVSHFPQ